MAAQRDPLRNIVRFERSQTPRERLENVLESLAAGAGPFRFALLRPAPLDGGLINNGDADLIGSRDASRELLRWLLQQSVAGQIHFRVTASRPEKLQLTIYSLDFLHSAVYDVWMDLPQIDDGWSLLRFDDLECVLPTGQGIAELPDCAGGAVYLHHLHAKHKPLNVPHTQARIRRLAAHRCDDPDCHVREWFQSIASNGSFGRPSLQAATVQLERLLGIRFDDCDHRTPLQWKRPRRPEAADAVCVLGVDGVGKSTLIDGLVADGAAASEALTGKKLYRRSLVYRVLTHAARKRDLSSRESFDERHCVPLYLRSVSALRRTIAWRRMTGQGTLLIDRCPLDFLYCGRKGDAGHFHPATDRLARFAPATATVQLVASHAVTSSRKAELTETGHAAYDEAMLLRHAATAPCDHLVFHNGESAAEGRAALTQYLSGVLKTHGRKRVA